MTAYLLDWASLFTRWLHIVAGIAWIGASFYFIWVENALERLGAQRDDRVAGHLWAVHGGGFYYLEKYKTTPEKLPPVLHWFKWEAYTTWFSGLLLMTIVYYFNAQAWLLNPAADLAPWQGVLLSLAVFAGSLAVYVGLCSTRLLDKPVLLSLVGLAAVLAGAHLLREVFTPRATMIHIGAVLGMIMAANVAMVIIPGQKRLVAMVGGSEAPDPALVKRGILRSTHNNYLTLPVVFLMFSSHYPGTYSNDRWLAILAAVFVGSFLLRHFFNLKNRKQISWRWAAAGCAVLAAAVLINLPKIESGPGEGEIAFSDVRNLVGKHCTSCHAASPSDQLFTVAPLGFVLDSDELIMANAEAVYQRTVVDRSMPFNNQSQMTDAEREVINQWYLGLQAGQ